MQTIILLTKKTDENSQFVCYEVFFCQLILHNPELQLIVQFEKRTLEEL